MSEAHPGATLLGGSFDSDLAATRQALADMLKEIGRVIRLGRRV